MTYDTQEEVAKHTLGILAIRARNSSQLSFAVLRRSARSLSSSHLPTNLDYVASEKPPAIFSIYGVPTSLTKQGLDKTHQSRVSMVCVCYWCGPSLC